MYYMGKSFDYIKISVIIPNFNGGKYIEWCLEAILAQSYEQYEIIIVDWKSTDHSHAIIEKYQKLSSKITWLKVHDTWISNGFNLWIKAATWDFVLLLWSDDYLYEEIFQKLVDYLNKVDDFGYIDIKKCNVFCDSINYWSSRNEFVKRTPQTTAFTKDNLIAYGNICGFQNMYINRAWFTTYTINEQNKYSMDYECYFEMLEKNQSFIYLPEINSKSERGKLNLFKICK